MIQERISYNELDISELITPPSAAYIQPGDTLVIRTSAALTDEEFDRFSKLCKEKLPDCRVLVISNVEQLLVYRPDNTNG